ncbi:hypothetical protein ACSBR1_028621 [Camellia fascicularis]
MGFVGIQTGFASVVRRRSLRQTWMPSDQQGLQWSSLKAVGVAHNALVGSVVIWLMIKDALKSPGAVKCSQRKHKYHEACLKEHTYQEVASNTCFCGESCQEVYKPASGL